MKSQNAWGEYCKSGNKPDDIPAAPARTYAEAGWEAWGDWLGTGTVAPSLRKFMSFKEAKVFVHGLGLKSRTEWQDYCKSGKRPHDIPAYPNQTYKDQGWTSMGDWLGTGRARRSKRGLGSSANDRR